MFHKLKALLLALITAGTAMADNGEKSWESRIIRLGITLTAIGENDVYTSSDLVGAPGYDGNGFTAAGIVFSQNLNDWLEWESGFEYAWHKVIIRPNLPPQMNAVAREEKLGVFTVPFTLRAGFLKYFFVSGGMMLDIDARPGSPISSQSGIGPVLGTGARYDFRRGISVFINPYARIHALLPFSGSSSHEKLLDSGIRIGLTYTL